MLRIVRRIISVFAISALSAALAPAARAAPEVVVSIAPVHSLVAAVMGKVATPKLLVPPGASPHAFSLRPSDARALANADIVFRVGADLEIFLDKPLAALVSGIVVTLADAPGITEQPITPNSGDAEEHTNDPHIWLSIANARLIGEVAAQTLGNHDPENAGAYGQNLAALNERLNGLERDLRDQLRSTRKSPYVVLHDAYRHFEAEFGLQRAAAISLSPERRPGARRLREIRGLLAAEDVRCVFAEPQFPNAIAASVTEGTNARLAELDPIGAGLAVGPELYFDLMYNLGRSMTGCLGG
ncbi:MAG: zinc transport system substrate-binding protein [Alphaproteobacteria bacterium]|jgi:zinc transport system substrate-binding protein